MPDQMISPGIRVNVVDQSQYTALARVPTNVVCIIGAAQKGRVMEPTEVVNFVSDFGTPIDLAGLTAAKAVAAGGTVFYLRLADGTETSKSAIIPGSGSAPTVTYSVESAVISTAGSAYKVNDELSIAVASITPLVLTVNSVDGSDSFYSIDGITIDIGGTDYAVGDTLTITGDTGDTAAVFSITQVDTGGVVQSLEPVEVGHFVSDVAGSAVTPVTDGSGTGAALTISTMRTVAGGITGLSITDSGSYAADPAGSGIAVTGGSGAGALVTLTSSSAEVPVGGVNLLLSALTPGTLSEGTWYAHVTGVVDNKFTLSITRKIGAGEQSVVVAPTQLSLDPTASNYYTRYTGNDQFSLISDTPGEDPESMVNTPTGGIALSSGSNGAVPDDASENVEAITRALDLLSDSESYDFIYITAPQYSANTEIATLMLSLSKSRDNSIVQIDHPSTVSTIEDIIDFFAGLVGSDHNQIGLWAGLNLMTADEYNNGSLIPVPPSVVLIPAIARLYASNDAWTPPASVGNLPLNHVRSATTFSQSERDKLYATNINPLTNYRGLGWTAMGQKTGQTERTALDRLNVRQLINNIKQRLAIMSVDFLFSPIDEQMFSNWTYRANAILTQIAQRRGLYEFRIKLDFETTTPDHINNNIVKPLVWVKPTKVGEFIDIDCIIKNYSDSIDV